MSRERKQLVLPSKRCLLGLAEELQVHILLELGAADILTCTKVCHALKDLVNCTSALQYKLELGLAGMVDGPAQGVPVGKRLEQLRAYQAAWRENDIPLQTVTNSRNNTRCYFELLRPASVFSGITEESKDINYKRHLPSETYIQGCAVDLAQDLIVVTKLELGEVPELYILSISHDGAFHPDAAEPHFEGDAELSICIDPRERLEICGDLVAWTVATDSTDITVLNWKTGRKVWSTGEWHEDNPMFYMRCHFLDPTHLLIVENLNLHIHKVDPAQPHLDSAHSAAQCTLKLPGLAGRKGTHALESDIRLPPAYPGCAALFQRDPALTLLALQYSVCDDPMGYSRTPCKSFVALVPLATLFAQLDRTRGKGDTSQPGKTGGRDARAVVSWEEWSPLGARVVEVKAEHGFDICAMGSQCLVIPSKKDESLPVQEVYLFDAHPLAKDAPQAKLDLSEAVVRVGDCITEPEWFVNPVHSTLPYRVACKTYTSKAEPGAVHTTGPRYISHDGLLAQRYQH